MLGPVIRGVVGDTLKVTFRNKLQEHNVSMHPHGVWYDKDSEGSPYNDGLPCEWGPDPGGGGECAVVPMIKCWVDVRPSDCLA